MRSICQSPHSRLRRQCGVIDDVTARAVNIAGFQFITLIRHLTHNRASGCNFINPALTTSVAKSATRGPVKHPNNYNRASGCNFNNLTLTTSVAKSATWGKPMNPRGINRRAVADSAIKVIRVLYAIIGAVVVRGLRFAHPRLSPVGECRRVHVLHVAMSSSWQVRFSMSSGVRERGFGRIAIHPCRRLIIDAMAIRPHIILSGA